MITRLVFPPKRRWECPEEMIATWADDLTITTDDIATNPVFVAEGVGGIRGVFAVVPAQRRPGGVTMRPGAMTHPIRGH